jgi:hypothetical protein
VKDCRLSTGRGIEENHTLNAMMRSKMWSLPASLFCLAAVPSSNAAAAPPTRTLAFGMVPSSSSVPGGTSSSNENGEDGALLLRRLRADAAGIWSLKVCCSGGSTADGAAQVFRPSNVRGTYASRGGWAEEDPWSSLGQPTSSRQDAMNHAGRRHRRRQGSGQSGSETPAAASTAEPAVLLNLREDGSFRQCNEGYAEGQWMKGLANSETTPANETNQGCNQFPANYFCFARLYLALDRQYYGPPVDALYEGSLVVPPENDVQPKGSDDGDVADGGTANRGPMLEASASVQAVTGRIRTGTFALPKTDPVFFDRAAAGTPFRAASETLLPGEIETTFVLTQLVSGRSFAGSTPQPAAALTSSPAAWAEAEESTFQ